MKTVLTLIFGILISTAAIANTPAKQIKVEASMQQVTLVTKVSVTKTQNIEVARLYKFKNSRIKRELKFVSKSNKSKMA